MRIQTLRELGLGYKAITKKYPDKQWNLQSVKNISKRANLWGPATQWKPGSGRQRSARMADNIESVADLLCSQEDQPGTSKSTRRLASDLNISERSVRRIAKHDLSLLAFRHVPAQVIKAATKQKRLEHCKRLLRRLSVTACKQVFFTNKKVFYINPPVSTQNDSVVCWQKTWCLSKSAVDRESQVCTASYGLCRHEPHAQLSSTEYMHWNSTIPMVIHSRDAEKNIIETQHGLTYTTYIFIYDMPAAHTA